MKEFAGKEGRREKRRELKKAGWRRERLDRRRKGK